MHNSQDKPEPVAQLLERMRALEADHEPDGWPAVRMRDISALCTEIDALRAKCALLAASLKQADGEIERLTQESAEALDGRLAAAEERVAFHLAMTRDAQDVAGLANERAAAAERESERLRAQRQATESLAAFGAWCAREFRDSLSDLDGGSAQDEMERLGVIIKRVVTEPCGDGCVCAEYGEFPHDCYVFPDDVRAMVTPTAAIDSARKADKEQG